MSILVTGGCGFIGSNLCKYLLERNYFVISVDNESSGNYSNIHKLTYEYNSQFLHFKKDINNFHYNNPIFNNVKYIFHLACPASPIYYQEDPITTSKTCFIGTLNVLELARRNNARILFTSTSEVYGDPLVHPQVEEYLGNVNCTGVRACYDEGKRMGESLMFDYMRKYGVDIRVARIFNTYGPKMNKKDGRVISNFICQALEGKNITIYGTGNQTRSCCYVDDMVDGLYKFMEQEREIGPINLGNPNEEMTVNEIAYLIIKMVGNTNSQKVYKDLPGDDPKRRKPDITKAKRFWEPRIGMEEGIKKTIEYFMNIIN